MIYLVFTLFLLILFTLNVFTPYGWEGILTWEKPIIEKINTDYPNDIKISYGSPYYVYLNNSDWDFVAPPQIFNSKDYSELRNFLLARYGTNNSILLIVSHNGNKLISQYNPSFYNFMNTSEVYQNKTVHIYKINTTI